MKGDRERNGSNNSKDGGDDVLEGHSEGSRLKRMRDGKG